MSVAIRMKMMGRPHRPFFRVCAIHKHSPRDGKVLEELGYYDPMIGDVDARTVLNNERLQYWLSVGARPSERVATLISKYGPNGTHVEQQKVALERLKSSRPQAPAPWTPPPKPVVEAAPAESAEATETPAE